MPLRPWWRGGGGGGGHGVAWRSGLPGGGHGVLRGATTYLCMAVTNPPVMLSYATICNAGDIYMSSAYVKPGGKNQGLT